MAYLGKLVAVPTALALLLSLTTASAVTMSATPAFAERGGNGNGGGNGNSGRDRDRGRNENARGNNGNGNGNGRGQLSRELRGLNAAHANPNALRNASPNSMPGKLYAYQQSQQEFVDVVDAQNEDYAEYQRLVSMTEEEVLAEYPDGGYEEAVTEAANAYQESRAEAEAAQTTANESLLELTGGRELSADARAELHRMLGL